MRKFFVIIGILILFFLVCFLLQQAEFLVSLKTTLHSQSVHGGILNFGTMGKILKQMGVVKAVPNDDSRFPAPKEKEVNLNAVIFQKKRQVGEYMYTVNPGGTKNYPSSLIIDNEAFKEDWPLISIFAHDDALYDPEKGIISNPFSKGPEWEKMAYVSYYENGNLLFSSGVGLRLHGGVTRGEELSFRLYFREKYGSNQFKPGILFGPETEPLKTLVVHDDTPRRYPFTDCLAHDIALRVGCATTETQPAMLYLNGELQGIYFLTEHISRRQWKSRFSHENFHFYSYRGEREGESLKLYRELRSWATDRNSKISMEEVNIYVDLDNLSRFIFSFVFNGDYDWNQGTGMQNMSQPGAKWFWVNWDMDHSFYPKSGKLGRDWRQQSWELTTNKKRGQIDLRSVLFTRLREDSPKYRKYFVRMVMDILNHRLTDNYLQSRIEYYERLAISYGIEDLTYFNYLKEFMKHRPDHVREQMHEYFGTEKTFRCEVKGHDGIEYEIDGYPVKVGYKGSYFKGENITIKILSSHNTALSHWLVNGNKVTSNPLIHRIREETVIEPIFK